VSYRTTTNLGNCLHQFDLALVNCTAASIQAVGDETIPSPRVLENGLLPAALTCLRSFIGCRFAVDHLTGEENTMFHSTGKTHQLGVGCTVRALLLLAMFLSGRTVWGQATTSVRGSVTDPSGRAVLGATVAIANSESKTERTTTSGEQGEYQFLLLQPGTYTLTVTATGFARYEQTGLQLLVNTPATANIELKLGQSSQTVTVTSEAPALNSVDASIGNSFSETQVKQIPLEGRNVPDLLNLQAGVSYTGNRSDVDNQQDTRSGSVNGARSDQSNVTLDGVDVNDQGAGSAFTSVLPVTLDSVQEFRVTTTNYNADQGEGSGAQVALVTKSGTNNFHGSLYEYMRNTITSANDFFIKQAELASG
jgi:hypothetical protein